MKNLIYVIGLVLFLGLIGCGEAPVEQGICSRACTLNVSIVFDEEKAEVKDGIYLTWPMKKIIDFEDCSDHLSLEESMDYRDAKKLAKTMLPKRIDRVVVGKRRRTLNEGTPHAVSIVDSMVVVDFERHYEACKLYLD